MFCNLLQCSVSGVECHVMSCQGMSCHVTTRTYVRTYVCMFSANVAMLQALEWLVDFNCPKIISHPVVAARPCCSKCSNARSRNAHWLFCGSSAGQLQQFDCAIGETCPKMIWGSFHGYALDSCCHVLLLDWEAWLLKNSSVISLEGWVACQHWWHPRPGMAQANLQKQTNASSWFRKNVHRTVMPWNHMNNLCFVIMPVAEKLKLQQLGLQHSNRL